MRWQSLIFAVACAVGCGRDGVRQVAETGDGPQVSSVPRRFTFRISASGPGAVRAVQLTSDCRGDCQLTVDAGTAVHLDAVGETGATFKGWSGACKGAGGCDVVLQQDAAVAAVFERLPRLSRRLEVTLNGKGAVRSDPAGIDCPNHCAAVFDDGAAVRLTATPDVRDDFAGFGGDCSGSACTLALRADRRVSATFVERPLPLHALTVVSSGSGGGRVTSVPAGIDCPGACSASFPEGTKVALSAASDVLSRPATWSGACSGPRCTVTIEADTAATAQFDLRRYRVQDLGTGLATGISPHNVEVIGGSGIGTQTFLWSGTMLDRTLPTGDVRGVNDAAVVAGTAVVTGTATSSFHAYRWEGGVVTDLSLPGEQVSAAEGINQSGVIVGWYLTATDQHAVAWTSRGAFGLGSLSADPDLSSAYGINASGVAVGTSLTSGGELHAVRFRPGAVDDLGTLGGTRATAYGINDNGLIVGESTFDATGIQHGFLYQNGRMVDAGTLPGLPYSTLFAINAAGLAVGVAFSGGNPALAVIYGAGRLIDLNTLVDGTDLIINFAKGVDEAGVIVGQGQGRSTSRIVILWPE